MNRKGIINFASDRRFYFCEDLESHHRIFLHSRNVMDSRYLHPGDVITFDLVESTRVPGKFEAINVVYVDHVGGEGERS
jgi:'Cold-shock' DNA-binding domain